MDEIIIALYNNDHYCAQCNNDYVNSIDELFEIELLHNFLLSKFANIKQ